MFTAYHAPSDETVFKSGFATESEAWDYVHSQMCPTCQEGYKQYMNGDENAYFGCEGEWFVLPTQEFQKANSFEDILNGAGYKKVNES